MGAVEPTQRPRVLVVGSSAEDYLADSLFHGLQALLGANAVDVPRADHMYFDFPHREKLYGRGFSLFTRAPDTHPLRTRYEEQLATGTFDIVVFANIHRTPHEFVRLLPHLASSRVAILDGEDDVRHFPTARALAHHPGLLPLRFGPSWLYFKREWVPDSTPKSHDKLAAQHSLAPPVSQIRPISFSIPDDVLISREQLYATRTQDFPHHIVDTEVAAAIGRQTKYAFDDEAAYHADLAASRFGITTKRAGWDCLRHYEIAARGAIPCFRDLDLKPATCAPHGFDATNSLTYKSYADLRQQLATLTPERERTLREGAYAWAKRNTTLEAARRFLDVVADQTR